jgi:hypothetical protein
MFRWYQEAAKCYVYLSDVSVAKQNASDKFSEFTWEPAFRESRWFTRGWTLQELLAPGLVEFVSREGKQLGDKRTLERQIHEITGIAIPALRGTPLSQFRVDERLSWAENRQTTRKEDKAYSLLGIFDVFMSLIYGEGEENAFKRLRTSVQMVKEDQECIQHLRPTDPRRCIQLMSTCLKQDLCGIKDPGVLVAGIKSSQVKKCLPLEVQYACLYWVQHLQRSSAQFYNQVYQFLQDHFLHWLEALSWIGKTSEGILAIFSLEALIPVSLLHNIVEIHD